MSNLWSKKSLARALSSSGFDGGFASENATYHGTKDGWPIILSGLKTLLETGEELMAAG